MDIYLVTPVGPFHTAAGVAKNTFTTKQDISPVDLPVIQGGTLRKGAKIEIRANGEYSSLTGAALTLGFWFGTVGGTITGDIALSSVITTGTTPTAWPWWMEWEGVCISTGTAGTLIGQGSLHLGASLTTFNAEVPIPITQALRTVSSFDTTIARAIGVSGTWGASSASNTITVNNHRVLLLN